MLLIRKPEISWDKFRELISNRGSKIFQEKKRRKNEMLVYICFEIRKLVLMLTINSGVCLWK